MPKERQISIAVIGGSDPSSRETRIALEVGRELAERGAILVCGGLGGVMAAACQGVRSADGITVGILPGTNLSDANPHVQIPIVTGVGHARNMAVVKSARAVIAIGGSYGTLSEIAHALHSDIPVVGLDIWSLARGGYTDRAIVTAPDEAEAVRLAFALATGRGSNPWTGT